MSASRTGDTETRKQIDDALQALRRTQDFLEWFIRQPMGKDPAIPETIAALTLVRASRLLPGIVMLLDTRHAFAAEPLIRSLFDFGFNVGWIGASAERAAQFRDKGLRELRVWRDEMLKLVPDMFSAKALLQFEELLAEDTGQSSECERVIERRASSVCMYAEKYGIHSLRHAYAFAFRRLSAASHGDYWHLARANEEQWLYLDTREAVTAIMLLIMLAAETVGMTRRAEATVLELRTLLEGMRLDADTASSMT